MNKLWQQFVKACESQWVGGGKRYALGEDKEFTDLICEVVGNQWIGGNILKYAGEIGNYKKAGLPPPSTMILHAVAIGVIQLYKR